MRTVIRDFLTPLLVAILAGVVAFDHFDRCHHDEMVAVVDGVKLGRAYAPTLPLALGDAWLAAADTLEAGKSVGEAQEALQATFKAGRVKAFTSIVVPQFCRVLPEGTEPRDAAARAQVVHLWRDFARGLKGGR